MFGTILAATTIVVGFALLGFAAERAHRKVMEYIPEWAVQVREDREIAVACYALLWLLGFVLVIVGANFLLAY